MSMQSMISSLLAVHCQLGSDMKMELLDILMDIQDNMQFDDRNTLESTFSEFKEAVLLMQTNGEGAKTHFTNCYKKASDAIKMDSENGLIKEESIVIATKLRICSAFAGLGVCEAAIALAIRASNEMHSILAKMIKVEFEGSVWERFLSSKKNRHQILIWMKQCEYFIRELAPSPSGSVDIMPLFKIATLHEQNSSVVSMCLGTNETYLFSGMGDGSIHVWSLSNLKLVKRLIGHGGGVNSLLHDSGLLFSGSDDKHIRVWRDMHKDMDMDTKSGDFECVHDCPAHYRAVLSLAYHKRSKTLFSASSDLEIMMWRVNFVHENENEIDLERIKELRGYHNDDINCLVIDDATDRLFSCSRDQRLLVWDHIGDVEHIKCVHRRWSDTASLLSMCKDRNNRIFTGSGEFRKNFLQVWELDDNGKATCTQTLGRNSKGKNEGHIVIEKMHDDWISDIASDDLAGLVYSVSYDGSLCLWGDERGKIALIETLHPNPGCALYSVVVDNQHRVFVGDKRGRITVFC